MADTWPIMRLEELCQVTSSKRIYARELVPSGVPFLKSTEIIERVNGQENSSLIYISEERFQQIIDQKGALEAGDVLLTSRGTLGIPYVVRATDRFHFADGNLTWFRNFHRLDSSYLRYFFLSHSGKAELKKCVIGSSQQAYTIAALKKIEIAVPPISVQREIVGILSAYDDLIENNIRRIAILEEMARRIYEEWFVHFRFPGHEQAKLVESELGLIPEGWRWVDLREIAFDVRDSVNPETTMPDTPYVGLEHIPRRSLALGEWGVSADVQSTKLRFNAGDILFGKIRPYFHKVAVAPVAGVASSDAVVIRAKQPDWYPIIVATVSSDAFVAAATQSSNGTKMPRANWSVLLGYSVPLPTDEVLTQFNEFMSGIVDSIRNMTLKNRNLRATRDLLLPKLISGELDVSHLPEPEAVAA